MPPKDRGFLLWSALRGQTFLLPGLVLDSLGQCQTKAILTSHIDTFIFVESDQWPSQRKHKEGEKKKKVNSTFVLLLPQNPQGNFTDFRTVERLLGKEGSMSCLVSYYRVENNNPQPSDENLDLPPGGWGGGGSNAELVFEAATNSYYLTADQTLYFHSSNICSNICVQV